MFASLKRMDFVIAGSNGGPRVVQCDHRTADEITATRELSTVFALLRVLDPLRIGKPRPEVTYYLQTTPPAFLVEAVAAAGGRVFVGEDPTKWIDVTESAGGQSPRPVELIANEAMAALARRTAREAGLPLDPSGLQRYEQSQLPEDNDEDDDEDEVEVDLTDDEGNAVEPQEADGGEAKWTKIVKLASYAGEVLGQQVNGRWIVSMDHERTFALLYECKAGNKELSPNLLGKALKFSTEGMEDSLGFLVSTVVMMIQAG